MERKYYLYPTCQQPPMRESRSSAGDAFYGNQGFRLSPRIPTMLYGPCNQYSCFH